MSKPNRIILPCALALMILTLDALACSVPVFRYALERWERDLYPVFIIHKSPLSDVQNALVKTLTAKSVPGEGTANIEVNVVDLSQPDDYTELFEYVPKMKDVDATTPQIMLLYPFATRNNTIIWQAPFNQNAIDALTTSAATSDLMKGILAGHSTVFMLMESGNKEKDDAAFETVKKNLDILKKELSLPEGVVATDGSVTGGKMTAEEAATVDPSNVLESGIPLRISFEIVRFPAKSPDVIFRSILMNIEEDLQEYKAEPMVYSFFGRGRLLPPLIGKGINEDNIADVAYYLCGECSCQIKAENPGMDFLTNLDWYSYLEVSEVIKDKELPPLIGIADIEEAAAAQPKPEADTAALTPVDADAVDEPKPITTTFIIFVVVVIVVIGGLTVAMKKQS